MTNKTNVQRISVNGIFSQSKPSLQYSFLSYEILFQKYFLILLRLFTGVILLVVAVVLVFIGVDVAFSGMFSSQSRFLQKFLLWLVFWLPGLLALAFPFGFQPGS